MNWNEILQLLTPSLNAGVEGPLLYGVLLILGLAVGILTGFFGVGGGFMLVPLLNVVLGINYEIAVGSSLSFIIGTSFSGVLAQRGSGNVHLEVAAYLISGSVFGAVFGDVLQNILLFTVAGGRVELFTLWMHAIFILVLIGTIAAVRPGRDAGAGAQSAGIKKMPLLARIGPPPRFHTSETQLLPGHAGFSVPATFLVGFLIGITTGLLGIGGGVLLVPVLLGLFGLSHQKAAGTSLAIIFVTSIAAIIKKGFTDIPKVNLVLTMVLLISSVIGVRAGIALLQRTGGKSFRQYFVYVLLAVIILIGVDVVRKAAAL